VWLDGTIFSETGHDPATEAILHSTIAAIEEQGATVVPADILPFTDVTNDIYNAEFAALLCESKSDIASYLETYTGPGYPKTVAQLKAFNDTHDNLEGPWNSEIFRQAIATNGRDADCAAQRAAATPPTQAAIDGLLASEHLDAIIALTNGPAWLTDPVNGDLSHPGDFFVGSSAAAAIAGYPDITVPAGYVGHLPVGITFIGGRWDEPTLISLAYAFEQATHVRVPPTFLRTESATGSGAAKGSTGDRPKHGASPVRPGHWMPTR